MGSELYIVKKELQSDAKERVLKLYRNAKQLVVYKRVENEKIHDHYSIREDFDPSPYVMYEVENPLPVFLVEKRVRHRRECLRCYPKQRMSMSAAMIRNTER